MMRKTVLSGWFPVVVTVRAAALLVTLPAVLLTTTVNWSPLSAAVVAGVGWLAAGGRPVAPRFFWPWGGTGGRPLCRALGGGRPAAGSRFVCRSGGGLGG